MRPYTVLIDWRIPVTTFLDTLRHLQVNKVIPPVALSTRFTQTVIRCLCDDHAFNALASRLKTRRQDTLGDYVEAHLRGYPLIEAYRGNRDIQAQWGLYLNSESLEEDRQLDGEHVLEQLMVAYQTGTYQGEFNRYGRNGAMFLTELFDRYWNYKTYEDKESIIDRWFRIVLDTAEYMRIDAQILSVLSTEGYPFWRTVHEGNYTKFIYEGDWRIINWHELTNTPRSKDV